MQVEGTRLYRVKAVADGLDVSVATIYRAIETGALRAVRIGTGKGAVRIPGQALADYMAFCEQAAATRLSPARADGQACVICGADFRTANAGHYPVGRSHTGSQMFACNTHRDQPTAETAGEVPTNGPVAAGSATGSGTATGLTCEVAEIAPVARNIGGAA